MLNVLNDSGTFYVDPTSFELDTALTGSFDGIGATISQQGEDIVIVAPIKDTPAERAGLTTGDVITAVDGESTEGWNVERTVLRIRGPRGTDVTISITHDDGRIEDYKLTRARVQVESVSTVPPGGSLRDAGGQAVSGLGYVQIREFTPRTAQELEAAVREVVDQGARGLIIDVRRNLGGNLASTISSADLFLDNGTILIQRDGDGRETSYVAKSGQVAPDVPIVILQDRFSASASEVLAAALQENARATVIGEKSFGKGTVNTPRELPDGGALFVTIAQWLTPNGTLIDKVGIRPDIEVIPSDEDIDLRRDPQMFRAIEVLRGQVRAP
ncbi:MAG: PDZ domain-containing protein [Dehalococcoidia bacterium]|nr:PDZ domain-containing protein [Dehalococcoidia bacterium]